MTFKEFLNDSRFKDGMIRDRVICKDGFSFSAQKSIFHRCGNNSVEIGFPSEEESLIKDYIEDKENPLNTVYNYVPIQVVEKVIEKHGGIDGKKMRTLCSKK